MKFKMTSNQKKLEILLNQSCLIMAENQNMAECHHSAVSSLVTRLGNLFLR